MFQYPFSVFLVVRSLFLQSHVSLTQVAFMVKLLPSCHFLLLLKLNLFLSISRSSRILGSMYSSGSRNGSSVFHSTGTQSMPAMVLVSCVAAAHSAVLTSVGGCGSPVCSGSLGWSPLVIILIMMSAQSAFGPSHSRQQVSKNRV